jgi:hypothetical protein
MIEMPSKGVRGISLLIVCINGASHTQSKEFASALSIIALELSEI